MFRGFGMVGSNRRLRDFDRSDVDLLGLIELPLLGVDRPQVFQRRRHPNSSFFESRLRDLARGFRQRLGFLEPTLHDQERRESERS